VLDALTPATTVSVSSTGPVLPASYLIRDSEQIIASEALLVLQEGPRASESCWLKLFLKPKTSLRLRMSLSLQTFHRTSRSSIIIHCIELWRPTLDYIVPPLSRSRCCYTLPLHSTPMDEVPGLYVDHLEVGTQL